MDRPGRKHWRRWLSNWQFRWRPRVALVLCLAVLVIVVLALAVRATGTRVIVFGCSPFGRLCVVVLQAPSGSSRVLWRGLPRRSAARCADALGPRRAQCVAWSKGPALALGSPAATALVVQERKRCAEWLLRCRGAGANATVWFHHFHKASGSTFVSMAVANGATLVPHHANGNPVDPATGRRVPFWAWPADTQLRWAARARRATGVDLIVTEFSLPPSATFTAPVPFVYVTMLREPVARAVSHFFWRFRRHFAGKPDLHLDTARAEPQVGRFFADHATNTYVRLLATGSRAPPGPGAPDDATLLPAAKARLHAFSVVLICEWLDRSAPVLARVLGWRITDFARFHAKSNARAQDRRVLDRWDPQWRARLDAANQPDVELYEHAKVVAEAQLHGS